MKKFAGKTVVITGAASGIGRALAVNLASRGASLALADRNSEGLAETAAAVTPACSHLKTYDLDVSDRESVYRFADSVARDFGQVDVVINNAGVALSETVENMTYEDFEWVMNINFWGVVYGTKAFLPYLREAQEGCVVNLSSVFGLIGVPTQAAYNASKFAVRGFTEALRLELAGSSVHAICVHPGGIKTNIARNARFHTGLDGSLDRTRAVADFDRIARTSPEQAAETIVQAIRRNRERVLIGNDARVIDWVQRLLPDSYTRLLKSALEMQGRRSRQ